MTNLEIGVVILGSLGLLMSLRLALFQYRVGPTLAKAQWRKEHWAEIRLLQEAEKFIIEQNLPV